MIDDRLICNLASVSGIALVRLFSRRDKFQVKLGRSWRRLRFRERLKVLEEAKEAKVQFVTKFPFWEKYSHELEAGATQAITLEKLNVGLRLQGEKKTAKLSANWICCIIA